MIFHLGIMVDKGQHFRVCQIQEMQLLFYTVMKIDDALLSAAYSYSLLSASQLDVLDQYGSR